jgi:hypothetical protein
MESPEKDDHSNVPAAVGEQPPLNRFQRKENLNIPRRP